MCKFAWMAGITWIAWMARLAWIACTARIAWMDVLRLERCISIYNCRALIGFNHFSSFSGIAWKRMIPQRNGRKQRFALIFKKGYSASCDNYRPICLMAEAALIGCIHMRISNSCCSLLRFSYALS